MNKGRLEAFTDGVMAIIITIMVLEIKVQHGSSFKDLVVLVPILISYILSFIYIGIYWNNHHHLMQAAKKVNGRVLWANLHLLFWLSLVPFATGWMGENSFEKNTLALYGFLLFMAAVAYFIFQRTVIKANKDLELDKIFQKDFKGKISPVIYILGIGLSWVNEWLAGGCFFIVALLWLIPDKRIERVL